MKNILKIAFTVLLTSLILVGCVENDEVSPKGYYVSVRVTSGTSTVGFENESISIPLELRASQGIASLDANGTDIPVTEGEIEETVTYAFTVPANNVNTSIELTFTLTDSDGNEGTFVYTISTQEDPSTFSELDMIDLGDGEGAAEISAYDTATMQLFVVNNDDGAGNNRIDVLDFSDPSDISLVTFIDLSTFGGGANSVAVSQGRLAVAVQANTKTDNGVVLIWDTDDLDAIPVSITVGALPDMVTFSPDGNWILVANEGEPNDDYTVDPQGTVSIIDASGATPSLAGTATFTSFNDQEDELEAMGFRVFGPGATLAEDVEPEYITVSSDSQTAFVTLQENNGVAIIDIASATVTDIIPLGFKDYTLVGNEIDPSNADGGVFFRTGVSFPLYGVYQPDAIAAFNIGGVDYVITANEGDAREYEGTPGFIGIERVSDVTLDGTVFEEAGDLQEDASFGRLNMMLDLGDADDNDEYEAIYSYGARSFSIWDATGAQVFDSGNDLDMKAIAAGIYDDGRSDDKSVEPEGVVTGVMNGSTYAFVGLERVDAVAVYDVSTPSAPVFVQMIETGDEPEGLVFIPASESPNGRSLLVVSSEADGTVRVYQTN
ncbi:MAG: choice-of-anchor I family protein [Ekhidna sp.]|uniref:choice-of-anchor I family protein n=1 Tax=Ekhidna sp. TaxID=2608089 RepID=UPI0032EAAEE1